VTVTWQESCYIIAPGEETAMTVAQDNLPVIHFETQADWEAWLEQNHSVSDGLWLKIAKKGAGVASVSYPEAIDSALCYGWIDGQKATFDDRFWLQRFTRRRARSKWSLANRNRAVELAGQGRMRPSGLKEIGQAKADGRWDSAYESQSRISVPDDFQSKLDGNPRAREFFETLDSVNRYAILYRIQDAKKPETRLRRIEKYIDMLNAGKKIH
jgi:uncharacterized protein YdeI (YjbR/CyaY-like superfamily)